MSEYDGLREQNIRRQNGFFESLGLLRNASAIAQQHHVRVQAERRQEAAGRAERLAQQRARRLARQVRRADDGDSDDDDGGPAPRRAYGRGEKRLSNRLQGKTAVCYANMDELETADGRLRRNRKDRDGESQAWQPHTPYRFMDDDEPDDIWQANRPIMTDTHYFRFTKPQKNREKVFGHIPGVPVGFVFYAYEEMRWSGMQYETCAGISTGAEGCMAVVLNGGYEDDVDHGDVFTMTGSGGRSLKGTKAKPENRRTGPQTHDQQLVSRNLALSLNVDSGRPVRVIRGYKCRNADLAPGRGFRYDGLYELLKYDFECGLSGFNVYRFYFKRLADQPPAPWHADFKRAPLEPDLPPAEAEPAEPSDELENVMAGGEGEQEVEPETGGGRRKRKRSAGRPSPGVKKRKTAGTGTAADVSVQVEPLALPDSAPAQEHRAQTAAEDDGEETREQEAPARAVKKRGRPKRTADTENSPVTRSTKAEAAPKRRGRPPKAANW